MSASREPGAGLWRGAPPRDTEGAGIAEFLLLGALTLYWEMCLIRWVSTEIRIFAYYKNLPLLASFLGFGIGMLTPAGHERWQRAAAVRIAFIAVLVTLYPHSPLRIESAPAFFREFTWHRAEASAAVSAKFYAVVTTVFALNAAAFVPWGRRTGFYFERMRPVPAYSLTVAANLAGIGLFSLLSALGAPPVAWVSTGLAPLLALRGRALARDSILLAAVATALVVTGASYLEARDRTWWSPYYKITVTPAGEPPARRPFALLKVNQDYHQRILDLRPETVQGHMATLGPMAFSYDLPYSLAPADRVLVVGAGTGNDVAAALRHGARHVTAVEIDPDILALGRSLHPERPYDSPRVETVVADARSYLAGPGHGLFDTIVFGLLDSHTQVSGMNSLRLDNFVYTREGLAAAHALLEPTRGLLALSFSSFYGDSAWTLRRIYRILTDVFGEAPCVVFTGYDAGLTFFAGPAVRANPALESPSFQRMQGLSELYLDRDAAALEVPATDNWPFLYLTRPGVPPEHLIMIALVALGTAIWVTRALRGRPVGRFSPHFFLLGAAFLLIEARNLVAFSLLFGSTWQVNGIAIAGVLMMILAANLAAARARALPSPILYGLLLAALAAGLLVGPGLMRAWGPAARGLLAPLVLSLPVFFAGLIFIRSFSRAAHPAGALGANLIGGICGALLEYASLAFGIASLQYLAIALYLLSFIALYAEGLHRTGSAA